MFKNDLLNKILYSVCFFNKLVYKTKYSITMKNIKFTTKKCPTFYLVDPWLWLSHSLLPILNLKIGQVCSQLSYVRLSSLISDRLFLWHQYKKSIKCSVSRCDKHRHHIIHNFSDQIDDGNTWSLSTLSVDNRICSRIRKWNKKGENKCVGWTLLHI